MERHPRTPSDRNAWQNAGAAIVVRELRYVSAFVQEAPQRVVFTRDCTLAPGARLGEGRSPDAGRVGPRWLPPRELTARRGSPLGLRP